MPPKNSKKVQEVKVETVSDSDSDEISYISNSSDSDYEPSEHSESEEEQLEQKPNKGEKKPKKEVEEHRFIKTIEKITEHYDIISNLEEEIIELEKQLKITTKKIQDNQKQIKKLINGLTKIHLEEVKDKPKRTNNSKSGILKESPVPPILIKFLGLVDNIQLPRPKVMSLLNTKFKELGLKDGQKTILDAKTAKVFGLKQGHEIGFSEFQTFLAGIYESSNKKNNVVL
jgi:hypothetical protein